MYFPTTRMLTVLELLQTHGRLTGAELARRLEVDARSVRRYVVMLQDMGVPILGERGRHGAYQLGRGVKLPPLMFTNHEALALTVGLLAARRLGLVDVQPSIESAGAKLERVLPLELRDQVRAVSETTALDLRESTVDTSGRVLVAVSGAAQARRRLHIRYRTPDGRESARNVDPYGLAYRGGRWYMVGHCHLRGGERSFRLDRVAEVRVLEARFSRPAGFDPLAHLESAVASLPYRHQVRVRFETSLAAVKTGIPDGAFFLEPDGDATLLRGGVNDLDWMATVLARFTCPFEIHEPAALAMALRDHATRLSRFARRRVRAGGR